MRRWSFEISLLFLYAINQNPFWKNLKTKNNNFYIFNEEHVEWSMFKKMLQKIPVADTIGRINLRRPLELV